MDGFACPECHLQTRPAAFYFSQGTTWWSVSPAEASRYAGQCRHRETWPNGTIVGCAAMRASMAGWLRYNPAPPDAGPPDRNVANEISIEAVAVARHSVESRAGVAVSFAPVIADSFRDLHTRAEFERNPGTAEVASYDLHDVTLVGERLIMFKDGRRIAETRYIVDDNDYWRAPSTPRRIHDIGAEKTVILAVNLAFRNYYHWLMQSLPAIHYSIAAVGAANAVLALPPLAGWQEATLALLGYAGIPRIEIEFDCHYRFQRAHWCAYLNGVAEFFLSPRCLQVVNRLAADAPQIPDGPELIYVSRLDTTHRRIRNEDEVRQLLESLGFVTLVPGFLPFATQVGLFSNAHVVVGAHGAGLTNLAFCIPGTIVLELIQSTYANTYFNRIAQLRGLQYHAECFECEPADYVHDQAWTVDIAQLETKLRTLL